MNIRTVCMGFTALALGIAASGIVSIGVNAAEFSFTATNSTKTAITEIWVSEDKNDWGYFDIGKGIAPGSTVDLVWDQSTNSENCSQWVMAVYADGSESEAAGFNFCEKGLDLSF